jgi:hypothetical protein
VVLPVEVAGGHLDDSFRELHRCDLVEGSRNKARSTKLQQSVHSLGQALIVQLKLFRMDKKDDRAITIPRHYALRTANGTTYDLQPVAA